MQPESLFLKCLFSIAEEMMANTLEMVVVLVVAFGSSQRHCLVMENFLWQEVVAIRAAAQVVLDTSQCITRQDQRISIMRRSVGQDHYLEQMELFTRNKEISEVLLSMDTRSANQENQ